MASVVGIGIPLLDHVIRVTEEQLQRVGVRPGTMNLIDARRSHELRRQLPRPRILPGGSCANTLRGLNWLAAATGTDLDPALFMGVVGDDAEGDAYAAALQRAGVTPALQRAAAATGTSTILVTPDGERTMLTCLGASIQLDGCSLPAAALAGARAFYVTCFLCDPAAGLDLIRKTAAEAARYAVPVVLDIADRNVVERHRAALSSWVPGTVAVLLGNRAELQVLTGCTADRDVLAAAGSLAPIVVMKAGAHGALVWDGSQVTAVPTVPVAALDTTGAGDAFVAGFLSSWIGGSDLVTAAAGGNRLAGGIVQVYGCDYDRLDAAELAGPRSGRADP